ncbi:hypothetical protein [Mycolicibacterium insubricum]|uniref:hypothetical protein n=1 Tax=Mycolicibacterium insubricum TaxID=444597 RepID=UPI0021F29D2F|nr:hypothetical protein [Mycolicibacterium insubricum]MCV7083785.1 hypothetical protein [Mycolicibacterium insubricum]
MKAGLLDRLRAQFRTQSLRGEDVALWWQLPDDNHRVASPWKQLVVDLVQPPTFSQWHTKVAAARITHYDGLRGPVTRTGYLAVVASAMAAVGAPWWIWVLLVPAVMQVALEFLAYPYPSRGPERRRTSRILPARYERLQGNLNIPALIGLLADPLNLIAVSLAPSGGDVGWVKIAALAAAIGYLNSSLAGLLLDVANYTEASAMPMIFHTMRPWVPLLSWASVVAMVTVGVELGRWEPAMVPVATWPLCSPSRWASRCATTTGWCSPPSSRPGTPSRTVGRIWAGCCTTSSGRSRPPRRAPPRSRRCRGSGRRSWPRCPRC